MSAAAPMDQTAQAPASDPSTAPDDAQEAFSVTITSNGDGTYSVSSSDSDDGQDDQGADAAGGAQGQGDDDSGPQTAQSVDDALKIAGQMLQEEAGEDSQEPADSSDPQAVWNQLAKKTDAKRGAM